jgi:hypothetical protein
MGRKKKQNNSITAQDSERDILTSTLKDKSTFTYSSASEPMRKNVYII